MGDIIWNKVELYGANNDGQPRRFTVADGTQISKGILMALLDGRVASRALATTAVWAGVAMEDKKAGDEITSISGWTDGIFETQSSGAIALGAPLTGNILGEAKAFVDTAGGGGSGAQIIGYSNAIAAVNVPEIIEMRLRL